jgi:phosphopantothenoylcysteine decarboxylase/phosphopantothenate--cysteine ligase
MCWSWRQQWQDFRPSNIAEQKIKKTETQGDTLMVELVRNPDILLKVKAQRQETGFPRVVVGFAAESENLLVNAKSKLNRKGLHLLIANDISASDPGFEVDTEPCSVAESGRGSEAT